MERKLSSTYKFLRFIGLNFSEAEYGQISLGRAIKRGLGTWSKGIILKYCMFSAFFGNFNYRLIRPLLWRKIGCNVGKDVYIGYEVWLDIGNSELITLEDGVHIANRSLLLCHQRDLSDYCVGDEYSKLGYRKGKIHIKKGALIGMGTYIMPNVTIGEGAIIAAGSLVTKNIPDWTIAAGRPAKVIKHINKRNEE